MANEPPTKILRVDWYASDFLAGMAGHKLGLDGWGAYIGIISICYSERRPTIPENEAISRLASMSRCNPRTVRKAIEALVQGGKLTRTDGELEPKRVRMELERTLNRIRMNHESGAKGGRPSNKNKDLAKGLGLFSETLIPAPAPIPTPEQLGETCTQRAKRANRIDPKWEPSSDDRTFAQSHGIADIDRAAAEFRDYWIAAAGKWATKHDWSATWRNRVRQISAANGQRGPGRRVRGVVESYAAVARELEDSSHD